MRKYIRKCESCNSYTLKARHCGKLSNNAHPIDFKPFYKYLKQRLSVKYPWIK